MPEGFKLLDAYVEVKADATGIGEKVSKQFTGEVAPAAKKMADAVETATQRVAAASKRQADAAASLRLAQMRLTDVEKTSAEGSSQLVAAQEAVARAQRNVAASAESADRAQRSLGSAQTRLKESGSSAGSSYLSGLKGSLTTGVVGGLIGGVTSGITSGIVHLISTAVTDIGGMLTTVGGMVATTVIDYNSQLQSADIAFTTMLGSGRKAKGFLDELQSFAQNTPFEFTDVVRASQRLLAMGATAKDVIPYMTGIGDAVAGLGGGADLVNQVTLAIGQMIAKGKVQGDDLMQLNEAGIPALKILASSYGVTTSKMSDMISAGDVLSGRAVPAIIKGLENGTKSTQKFGGMMDKQSHTFIGALSNIKDGLTKTTAAAFKPFFDVASSGMGRFATALSGKPAEKFQKDVTKALQPLAKSIGDWFKTIDFNKIFKTGGKAVTDFFKSIKPKDAIKALQDVGKGATDMGRKILPLIPKIIKVISDFGPAFVAVVGWLADTTKAFMHGADQWHDAFDKAGKAFGVLVKVFQDGWAEEARVFGDIVANFQHGWAQIAGFVTGGVKSVIHGGQQIIDFFTGIPSTMTTIGGQIVSGLVGGIQGAWGAVTDTITGLVNMIPLAVRKLLGIASPSKVFHLIGTQVGQGLHLGMTSTVPEIQASAARLVAAATAGRVTGGKGAAGKAYAKSHNTAISATIADIRKDAKDLASLSKVFHDAARQVGQGIHKGLLGTVDQIRDTAQKMIDAVRGDSRFFGKGLTGRMVSGIKTGYRNLKTLSGRRDKASNTLATDRDTLAGYYQERTGYAENVMGNVMGNAGLSSLFMAQPVVEAAKATTLNGQAYQPSWTTTTKAGLAGVKASLTKLLTDTKKFAKNMAKLTKMHIDPYTYDELLQAGVRGGGLETSEALLADPVMAKSLFSLERQVAGAGQSLGRQTSTYRYAERIADVKDTIRTDKTAVTNITVQMVVEAKKIDEVQKLITMVNHVKHTARKGKK